MQKRCEERLTPEDFNFNSKAFSFKSMSQEKQF